MKKICIIAQFPPPIHGLSKAVDTLYRSNISNIYTLEKINITDNQKFLLNMIKIFFSKADLFYITISQSKMGNLRDLIIIQLCLAKKKRCLIHLHGGYYRTLIDNHVSAWQKKLNYKIISKVDGVIVLGKQLTWIFEGMVADHKIFTIANCVDAQYLMPKQKFEHKLMRIREDKVYHILYLSNFIWSKGYHIVLEMAQMEKQNLNSGAKRQFHFDFAGRFFCEEDRKYFYHYIRDNELDEFVTYHGIVSGKEKNNLLDLCTVFILPTKYPNEGQPISILEAMGNGMVIVTTNHAGIPDIVQDRHNGIVLDKKIDDGKQYWMKLSELVCDKTFFLKIIGDNRKDVEKMYTEEHYIKNLTMAFDKILNK